MHFSFFTFFTVSRHFPRTKTCVSNFPNFSLFLTLFHVLPCEFLIFLVCQFSHQIAGPTLFVCVCVCVCVCASVFCLFSRFSGLSPYSRSYSDCVSFSNFFRILPIFQLIQWVFLIFHVFNCFSPYSRSYYVSFSYSFFVSFLAIVQVLQCVFLIFQLFQCFSPYSRSYHDILIFLFVSFLDISRS